MSERSSVLIIFHALILSLVGSHASANSSDGLPAVLLCTVSGKQHYAYLSVTEVDGTARYMTLSGAFAELDPDGVVRRPQHSPAGDCAGRTVSDLRSSGQTREFAKPQD